MRLAIVAITTLLAAIGNTVATDERDLQVVACTADFNPVKCGLNGDQFDNQCLANAGGYTPSRCYPATCTDPDPNTACTFESNPVVCGGDLACSYGNYCQAQAAGFPPTACFAANCPAPSGTVACTLEYDPFICLVEGTGLCQYSNGCLATASGQNLESGNCVRQNDVPGGNPSSCPSFPGSVTCEFDFDPYRCLGECYYSNFCEANDAITTAGMDINDPAVCQSANCALPDPNTACTTDQNPVICYPDGCYYSNSCLATAAGHQESSCVSANCPQPPATSMCTREYDPQDCDNGCSYDNSCIANAAGATGCVSRNDPTPPASCPASDSGTVCTAEVNEVLCDSGDGVDCFYSNPCLALAAGFNNLQCRSPNCPKSDATAETCSGFGVEEVLCGPYQCPHLSWCFANRAGWVSAECTPANCPASDPNVICTLEYSPHVCFDASVYASASCVYSNGCLAQAAGYNTSPYAGVCVEPLVTVTRSASFTLTPDGATATDATNETESLGESAPETNATDAPAGDGTTDAPAGDGTTAPADGSTTAPDSGAAVWLAGKMGMLFAFVAYYLMV
ncbi:serine protease inhibitor dipetalogastin precursor [Seminavis robusta]|uniref:Serine protease inhibitor dipetalogastin n=1 Tax=Seminavis robusta TaxID=568900 RepID=A0A9N8DLL6_9STRA|nr:serine protease inhibitor dipetalogastin precursor [Seminavis robusta]|eukprot:Sro123_g059580.1 serine protease inhibitor dipetalogastin precursor (567) ;mRNA; f:63776-65476